MGDDAIYIYVQGSGNNKYKVTFTGCGQSLESFCTCPAFKRGAKFCKHVAMLLQNDTSRIIDGLDIMPELQERAQGSPLVERAIEHISKSVKPGSQFKSIIEIADYIKTNLAHDDYWYEYEEREKEAEFLTIFKRKYTKTGKIAKYPAVLLEISYTPYAQEIFYDTETGDMMFGEWQPRKKPYNVNKVSYGSMKTAGASFMEKFEAILKEICAKKS